MQNTHTKKKYHFLEQTVQAAQFPVKHAQQRNMAAPVNGDAIKSAEVGIATAMMRGAQRKLVQDQQRQKNSAQYKLALS